MRKYNEIFLCLNNIKTDWRNRLGQKPLDNLMIIREEGPSVEDFNPVHAINAWYDKMRRVGGTYKYPLHKYPAKRARTNKGTINLARVTLSDLKNDTDN